MGLSVCAAAGQGLGSPTNIEGSNHTMFKSTRRGKMVKVAAAAAAVGSIAAIGFVGNSPAQADPLQYTDPIFGFGSDTLQDVTNAFAGYSNDNFFTPVQSDNGKVIVSWDAFDPSAADATVPNCITTKVGTGQMLRPNGSGNGWISLSSAVSNQDWPRSGSACGGPRKVGGLVDFARSSGGPAGRANPNGPLQFIPAFKDALHWAYVRPTGSPVTDLSPVQLSALHTTGPQLIGGVPVIACGIQTGSGTYATWMANNGIGVDPLGQDTGTAVCNGTGATPGTDGRLQENNSPDLLAKGLLLSSMQHPICDGALGGDPVPCTNAQLIVGYSASQFIARGNGVGSPDSNLSSQNGGLGRIDGRQAVTGTAPNLAPVQVAYDNATFGRTVFYIVPFAAIQPGGDEQSPAITDMFVTSSPSDRAKFCLAAEPGEAPGTTIEKHGFLQIPNCGEATAANRANLR